MKKLHYFLVAGQIIFHTKEGEPGSILLNGVVTNSDKNIPIRLIGKAQQVLQMQFFKKVEDATITVVDVPITAFIHLGQMTEKEFHASPEGTKLQEKVEDPFAEPDKPKVADTAQPTVN